MGLDPLRLAIFEEMAPLINDLLCYFRYIGRWKELQPSQVIDHKRTLDRTVHVNQALFSEQFLAKYNNFMNTCYLTYTGWGEDPKLLTLTERRKKASGDEWETSWDDKYFAKKGTVYNRKKVAVDPTEQEVKNAYNELIVIYSK